MRAPLRFWMPDIYTLYVYGDANMDMLRQAKHQLSVPWKIIPREAVPGDSPVLCWQGPPGWACDYAASKEWTVAKLVDAIPQLVGVKPLDRRVFRMADWFTQTMGRKVVEVWK